MMHGHPIHQTHRHVRRLLALAAALVLTGVSAAAADAPPITVTVHPRVTPNVAGTPAHPQGVRLDVRIGIGIPTGYEPPLVDTVDIWFPHGGVFNGARYPRCSAARMNAGSPSACPRGSIFGYGTGVARADTSFTYPRITVVNGGAREVYFYTVLNNPARVQQAVPGRLTRLSGRWSYRLHIVIPRDLQIVAGVPIVLQSLHIVAGRANWIATTSCPADRRWAYRAITHFNDGQTITTTGGVACRP